jgi:hypothetical protein
MRNLLALLAFLLLTFTGTGVYRGWFSVEILPSEAGHSAFRIDVNRWKVADDVRSAASRIVGALKSDKPDAAADTEGKP